MAAPTVSNDRGDSAAALANAHGRVLAARFARQLTPGTAGMNRLEGELGRLSEDERIGFASMVEHMLLEAARSADVQAMAEHINGRYLAILAKRSAAPQV